VSTRTVNRAKLGRTGRRLPSPNSWVRDGCEKVIAITTLQNRWWARQDSNLQPDRYERSALTIELQALRPPNG
jgi:hypothetical protein